VEDLERLVFAEGSDLLWRGEGELVPWVGVLSRFDGLRQSLFKAADLVGGSGSECADSVEEIRDRLARLRLTVYVVSNRAVTDEPVDRGTPDLPIRQAREPGTVSIRHHVEIKPPAGRERASVALSLHDDGLDATVAVPIAILRQQGRGESVPPRQWLEPELAVSYDQGRSAQPHLTRGVADDLIRLIADDPQVNEPTRSIRKLRFSTQILGEPSSRLCDLGADVSQFEVQPAEGETQIVREQLISHGSESVILTDHVSPSPLRNSTTQIGQVSSS
jgi:hypothetical protein